jgi:hypothetical protein
LLRKKTQGSVKILLEYAGRIKNVFVESDKLLLAFYAGV